MDIENIQPITAASSDPVSGLDFYTSMQPTKNGRGAKVLIATIVGLLLLSAGAVMVLSMQKQAEAPTVAQDWQGGITLSPAFESYMAEHYSAEAEWEIWQQVEKRFETFYPDGMGVSLLSAERSGQNVEFHLLAADGRLEIISMQLSTRAEIKEAGDSFDEYMQMEVNTDAPFED